MFGFDPIRKTKDTVRVVTDKIPSTYLPIVFKDILTFNYNKEHYTRITKNGKEVSNEEEVYTKQLYDFLIQNDLYKNNIKYDPEIRSDSVESHGDIVTFKRGNQGGIPDILLFNKIAVELKVIRKKRDRAAVFDSIGQLGSYITKYGANVIPIFIGSECQLKCEKDVNLTQASYWLKQVEETHEFVNVFSLYSKWFVIK